MKYTIAVILLGASIVTGCAGSVQRAESGASTKPEETVPVRSNIALFAPTQPAPSPEELLSLTSEQAEDFLAWYNADRRAERPGHHRIRDYLLNHLYGFEYVPSTLTPSEALARNEGNCMSLAALTYSLTRLAGLEHDFQLVNTPPMFDRERDVILTSDHVRSRIYDPTHQATDEVQTLGKPYLLVDYFTERSGLSGSVVSYDRFLAMFYRNLATEAYIAGDLDYAFTLTRAALEREPDQPDTLNLLALLHRRAGDSTTALAFYEYITQAHGLRPDVLNNHANLLRAQGRDAEARALEWRLTEMDDTNPFHWIALGEEARQRGEMNLALQWFEVAIDRAPYLDEAYWQAAVVHYEEGRHELSNDYLRTAVELATRGETEARYRGKLQALNRDPERNMSSDSGASH